MNIKGFEINKKVINIIAYTLLIFFTVLSISNPKSYPKYYEHVDTELAYDEKLYSLYKGEELGINIDPNSTNLIAHFTLSFNRNDVVRDRTSDTYTIKLPDNGACYFKEDGTSITPSTGGVVKGNSVTYKSANYQNQTTIVDFYCNVNELEINPETNKFNLKVLIEEQVGIAPEFVEDTFLYKKISLQAISKSEYYDLIDYVEIPDDYDYYQLIIPERARNKEELFDTWIKRYANLFVSDLKPYETKTITDYVDSAYKDNNGNYKDITKQISLSGLVMEHKNGNYIYTIKPNFFGYARTYEMYKGFNSGNMYFSTDNATEMENAINYYMDNYYYTSNKTEIMAYIKSYGFDKLIKNEIPGITVRKEIYTDSGKIDEDNNLIVRFNSNILNFIHIPEKDEALKINFMLNDDMLLAFESNIARSYDFINSSLIYDMEMDDPFYYSLIKNGWAEESDKPASKSYSDYFAFYDATNKQYVLMNISSDVEKNPSNTFVTVSAAQLTIPDENFRVELTNSNIDDTKLTVKLSYQDSTDEAAIDAINEVIEFLDTYFGVTTNVNDSDFNTSGSGTVSISYNVTKTIIR